MFRSLRSLVLSFALAASLLLGIASVGAASASATLTAGSLAITTPPANFSYSGTLTGDLLTLSSSFAVSVNDATGSKAGWNLQATIGTLTSGTDTIPAANHTIQSVATSGVTGTAPVNAITYPLAMPTSGGKIFNSAAAKGMGKSTETFTTQLVVPADAAAGSYSTTLTVTIVSGP